MTHPFPWVDRLTYWQRAALALDEFCGALLWGGTLDLTISSRCYYERDRLPWWWLYLALNGLSPRHCERAWKHDRHRARAMSLFMTHPPDKGQ